MGESAGAVIVDALLQSTAFSEERLFQRVVISSGNAVHPTWGMTNPSSMRRMSLKLLMGGSDDDDDDGDEGDNAGSGDGYDNVEGSDDGKEGGDDTGIGNSEGGGVEDGDKSENKNKSVDISETDQIDLSKDNCEDGEFVKGSNTTYDDNNETDDNIVIDDTVRDRLEALRLADVETVQKLFLKAFRLGCFLPWRPFREARLFPSSSKDAKRFVDEASFRRSNVSILMGWNSFEMGFMASDSKARSGPGESTWGFGQLLQ